MTRSVARILDANANRAREALRVMEDFARFLLDDKELSSSFKSARHRLRDLLDRLPEGTLEAHRDTPDDVGTTIATPQESDRQGPFDVALAAGKRLSEALRCIEEYGKTIDAEFAAGIEALRYESYTLEQRLLQRAGTGRQCRQWAVCVLLTESLCKLPWLDVLDAAIEGGADCIQLREKELDGGKLLGRATAVVTRCHEAGITAIINDRPDIALLAEADGVHLGQTDLPVKHVRQLAGRRLLIGVSTANLVHAEAAQLSGADYCGVGPMFPSQTKVKPNLAGPEYLRQYVESIFLPHLAISGITPDNISTLVEHGARGVAVSSCVCGADDPAAVVRTLRATLPVPDGDAVDTGKT